MREPEGDVDPFASLAANRFGLTASLGVSPRPTGAIRGQGALGVVRETGVPGVLIKTFPQPFDFLREAALWEHTRAAVATDPVCAAGLPFLGRTSEGITMADGGQTLYAAAPALRRQDRRDGFSLRRFVARLRRILVSVHRRAGIEHRDLNPLNVLVSTDARRDPSLIDLTNAAVPGFERTTTQRHTLRVLRASVVVRSPEETMGMEAPPFAHDAWALGALIVWLMTDVIYMQPEESPTSSSTSDDGDDDHEGPWESSDTRSASSSSSSHSPSPSPSYLSGSAMSTESESASSSTSSSGSSLLDRSDPFCAMLYGVRDLIKFYGSPTNLRVRRRWWIALGGTLQPVDGYRGDPVVSSVRRRRWDGVCREDVLCSRATWRRLRVLASLLLSYDPDVRVQALHDDRLWREMDETPSPAGAPCVVPPETPSSWSIRRSPLAMPLPHSPLLHSVLPPPRNLSLLLSRMFDETLSPDASPDVSRLSTTLIEALRRVQASEGQSENKGAEMKGPETCSEGAPLSADDHILLYAAAIAIVASILVGCFGNSADVVLRPNVLTRIATLPHSIVALTTWMMHSQVVASALDISTGRVTQQTFQVEFNLARSIHER